MVMEKEDLWLLVQSRKNMTVDKYSKINISIRI